MNDEMAGKNTPKSRRKQNRSLGHRLDHWIHRALGDEWGGFPSPPGTAAKLEFGELSEGQPMFVATTDANDGFDLWIGYRHKWLFQCRADDARRLAWFIAWDWWIKGTWCGLKRKIWYWSLSRIVRRARGIAHE